MTARPLTVRLLGAALALGLALTACGSDDASATTEAATAYDVFFGTNSQYQDLPGKISQVDGTWVVSRAEFCGFMSSARVTCPAA